jgi:hypothetical protein
MELAKDRKAHSKYHVARMDTRRSTEKGVRIKDSVGQLLRNIDYNCL